MDKKRVVEILDEIGTLLELTGENPFRSRAYHNAAQVISGLTDDIDELARQGSLISIKGIGQGLADTITELIQTGKTEYMKNSAQRFHLECWRCFAYKVWVLEKLKLFMKN